MHTSSTQRDPRSIVTPDAFHVSEALLGKPLAPPKRRLAALLIDLVVIGIVTLVTRSFALVLGVVVAGLLMRAGFKRTPVQGSVFGRAMRFSVGCLGFFVAATTAVVWASCGVGMVGDGRGDGDGGRGFDVGAEGSSTAGRVLGALADAGVVRAFEEVETLDEAERVTRELVEVAEGLGVSSSDLRNFLAAAVPEDATWADEADAMFDRVLPATVDAAPEEEALGLEEDLAELSDDEALSEYVGLLRADDAADEANRDRRAALGARLAPLVASDTLGTLAARIESLERTNRSQQRDLERMTEAAEADSGGLFGGLREFADELGFGFGWWALYLTIFLSVWKGQTVGKRMMGIRVVRLDGSPLTWWVAFERAGGYAAGFATGLLGFAQVYWDANRQAIHDRIAGTVVVDDRAETVADWESAL
jgi:hypothetical protein